jgi:hypothetical protein
MILTVEETRTVDKISAGGKPYKQVHIVADGKKYSCFESEFKKIQLYTAGEIKAGSEIDVEVEEKMFKGKPFYNIKPLNGKASVPQVSAGTSEIMAKLDLILEKLKVLHNVSKITLTEDKKVEKEIEPDGLDF